jgi:hypothetical protein
MTFFVVIAVIIGIFILIFGIIRPISNKINTNISDNDWETILKDPATDISFKQLFGIDNFSYIIETILKPLNINRYKFVSNLTWLATQGDEYTIRNNPIMAKFNIYTPSIKAFTRSIDRPPMPIWYIAAFPDINLWMNNDNVDLEYAHETIHGGITDEELDDLDETGFYSIKGINIIKKMVLNYLNKVKPFLEVQTSPVKL